MAVGWAVGLAIEANKINLHKNLRKVKKMNNQMLQKELSDKLMLWSETEKKLKTLKKIESELRDEIAEYYFNINQRGTQKKPLGGGYNLVVEIKENLKIINNELLDICLLKLDSEFENLPDLIKTKSEININEYKKLTPEQKEIFDDCLISQMSKPKLSIKLSK